MEGSFQTPGGLDSLSPNSGLGSANGLLDDLLESLSAVFSAVIERRRIVGEQVAVLGRVVVRACVDSGRVRCGEGQCHADNATHVHTPPGVCLLEREEEFWRENSPSRLWGSKGTTTGSTEGSVGCFGWIGLLVAKGSASNIEPPTGCWCPTPRRPILAAGAGVSCIVKALGTLAPSLARVPRLGWASGLLAVRPTSGGTGAGSTSVGCTPGCGASFAGRSACLASPTGPP